VSLEQLGVRAGDRVRFRRRDSERWKEAVVERLEKDGSLGLREANGASRANDLELFEVRSTGPTGGVVLEPVGERAAPPEQIPLW
jgi:hypothetical protein